MRNRRIQADVLATLLEVAYVHPRYIASRIHADPEAVRFTLRWLYETKRVERVIGPSLKRRGRRAWFYRRAAA